MATTLRAFLAILGDEVVSSYAGVGIKMIHLSVQTKVWKMPQRQSVAVLVHMCRMTLPLQKRMHIQNDLAPLIGVYNVFFVVVPGI